MRSKLSFAFFVFILSVLSVLPAYAAEVLTSKENAAADSSAPAVPETAKVETEPVKTTEVQPDAAVLTVKEAAVTEFAAPTVEKTVTVETTELLKTIDAEPAVTAVPAVNETAEADSPVIDEKKSAETTAETAALEPLKTPASEPAAPVLTSNEPEPASTSTAKKVYTVWRVYNADMLRLQEDEKLVLAGVDSPEYFLNSKQYRDASRAKIELKTMRWAGKQASRYMRSLVQGRKITVETLPEPRDSRGRLVGYAFLHDGTFVNAEMVRAGYARVTTRGDQDQYHKQLLKLQDEARENNRGLWAYGIFQKLNA